MAFKIDEIMDLSLDDYIAISKKSSGNPVTKNIHEKVAVKDSSSMDTKFGRRRGNIDDEEEDEDDFSMQTAKEDLKSATLNEEPVTEIWEGPDSSTTYLDCHDTQKDLREKLNNSSKKSCNVSAVQYRLMAPNNAASRPRGIPTLLPLDFQMHNGYRTSNRGNRRNRGNRGNNNFQRNFNNAQNNSFVGGVSTGRVQKNRNQNTECKNFRFAVSRNTNINNLDGELHSPTGARNMIIETPSSSINLVSSPPLNSSFQFPHESSPKNWFNGSSQAAVPVRNLTPQAEAVLNLNSMTTQASSSNESLKSLLGFQGNVSGEMMPIFASRLMDYIQNGLQNPVVHKPVYDMKIQKDIHELQKKPLLYKCPGGEVVSSDGAGVNCKIIPRTSGVSLNCRFA